MTEAWEQIILPLFAPTREMIVFMSFISLITFVCVAEINFLLSKRWGGSFLSTKDEHWKLFLTYFNIASAGTLVAACATTPLAITTSEKMDLWKATDYIVILLLGSLFFHGVARVLLLKVKS